MIDSSLSIPLEGNFLGIETSCDETSVAVISKGKLTANLVSSQDFHADFGGVVPELSSRAHLQIIIPLLNDALKKSGLKLKDMDAVCATAGPGLIGALLVGLTFAKGLSYSLKKPFIPVNHIEGHIYSGFLMQEKPEFPYLVLVVSGGHTLLLLVKSFREIKKLGSTVDDAAGEAFDKAAKMLGLKYPGGPEIQKYAQKGDPLKIKFPVAELKGEYDFSFSGLKTSLLRYIQKNYGDSGSITEFHRKIPEQEAADIAASFQEAVVKALIQKTEKAMQVHDIKCISLVGGVAANKKLRDSFKKLSLKYNKKLVIPALEYCGDNGAMIAFRGAKLFELGKKYSLDYAPYPGLTPDHFS
ncbi:MAG TPA: tRNA (adenosine(37)-N6)-threonylcarbamoyltransferase complex transferase subunit TsaD [Ignavibacteriaceae bacterium]|nr:tRNA (adenosine(37)-N6)-threonylcarbamoyltransferase complex transferase subunit TsaD [Ignavibacteriaceae bacterium]